MPKPNSKRQGVFTALDFDTNPSLVAAEKGIMLNNRNGKVFKGNGRDLVWENSLGNKRIFSLPVIDGSETQEAFSSANIYYFDGRSINYSWINNVHRAFIIEIYSADATTNVQVLLGTIECQIDWNTPTAALFFGTADFGGATQSYADPLDAGPFAGWSIEHYFHFQLNDFWNTFVTDKQGLVFEVFKHGTQKGQPNFVPELEQNDPNLVDFTWYNKITYEVANFNLHFKFLLPTGVNPDGSDENATNRYYNFMGWGDGSENSGINFPSKGPFFTPGEDHDINVNAIARPKGIITNFIGGRAYCVQNWRAYLDYLPNNMLALDPTKLKSAPAVFRLPDDFAAPAMFLDRVTKIIECWPEVFAYYLLQNVYSADVMRWPEFLEVVGHLEVDESRVLLFCSLGITSHERTIVYLLQFNETGYTLTSIIDTTEDLNIGIDTPLKSGFVRVEAIDNILAFWTSGVGHLRTINITDPPTENFEFNTRVFKPVDFGKIFVSDVMRHGGTLLVGSYQFCYDLSIDNANWTRASAHSNAVSVGQAVGFTEGTTGSPAVATFPLAAPEAYNIYRGFVPGTKTTESIEVTITNIDRRYKFIRVYALEMISGSGDDGVVTNEIYNSEIKQQDYNRLCVTHAGIQSDVDTGLSLSVTTLPATIVHNVNAIADVDNRLIIVGYDSFTKIPTEAEIESLSKISFKQINQCVGSDHSEQFLMGYKSWFNQQHYKSLSFGVSYEFAWVLEDEYGNQCEPCGQFNVLPDDNMKIYDFKQYVNSTTRLGYTVGVDQFFNNCAYMFYAIGLALSFDADHAFPFWAKKARLVRKVKNNYNEKYVWGVGYRNHETATVVNPNPDLKLIMSFIPDIYGYNSNEHYGPQVGDEVFVYSRSIIVGLSDEFQHSQTGVATPGKRGQNVMPLQFISHPAPAPFQGLEILDIDQFPLGISHKISDIETKNYGIDKIPSYEITLDTPISDSEAMPVFGGSTGGDYYNSVLFLIRRKSANIVDAVKKVYENTGFELDLRSAYEKEKDYYVFGGDAYISSAFGQNGAMDVDIPETQVSIMLDDFAKKMWPWMPVTSTHNYSMGTPGWNFLPISDESIDYLLLSFNKDMSPTNSKVPMLFISEDFLKPKIGFKNALAYTDVKTANSKIDAFTKLKADNFLEIVSPFGEINMVMGIGNFIVLFFTTGIAKLFPNDKELFSTTSGTRVSVGDATYLLNRNEIVSYIYGTNGQILRTNRGIYFIDKKQKLIGFIGENGELSEMSIDKSVVSFVSGQADSKTIAGEFLGYTLGYDRQNDRVYIQISNKVEIFANVIFTSVLSSFIVQIDAQDIILNIGDIVSVINDNIEAVVTIVDYDNVNNRYVGSCDRRRDGLVYVSLPLGSPILSKITKSVYDIDCIVFNEKTVSFEFTTSEAFSHLYSANKKYGIIGPHNNNSIFVDDETGKYNEDNVVDFGIPSTVSFNTQDYTKWWLSQFDLITEDLSYVTSKPINTLVRGYKGNVSIDSSLIGGISRFFETRKKFKFIKGYTYRIFGFLNWDGDTNDSFAFSFGVVPFFYNNANYITITEEAVVLTSEIEGDIGVSFVANKTFESPLCLFKTDGFTPPVNPFEGIITLDIIEVSQFEDFEASVEVVLNKQNVESYQQNHEHLITFDNGVLEVTENTPLPDRIEVWTPEQNQTLVIDTQDEDFAKKRFGEVRFSVPFLYRDGNKERIRGTFVKIKVIFKNNLTNFVIQAIKSYFRDSI